MTIYESGTVAMIRPLNAMTERRALRVGNIGWHLRPCSDAEEQEGRDFILDDQVAEVRPLVTLDLYGRADQFADFIQEIVDHWAERSWTNLNGGSADLRDLIRQIRTQARRKPAEPTDPAARVTDGDEHTWASHEGLWFRLGTTLSASWAELVADFGPVEVLG